MSITVVPRHLPKNYTLAFENCFYNDCLNNAPRRRIQEATEVSSFSIKKRGFTNKDIKKKITRKKSDPVIGGTYSQGNFHLTSALKSDYINYLDFVTKEQSELRNLLSSETTIARFLHLNDYQSYSETLRRNIRVLKMVIEIVDPYKGGVNTFYGAKIHLKIPGDPESDKVLKVVRSDCLDDITYVLQLKKENFSVAENWRLVDLKDEWNRRLFVCEDLTKLGFSNNPANSMSKLFAFEPKNRDSEKKLKKMKRGLDRVFDNFNQAQDEMNKLNNQKNRNDPIEEVEEAEEDPMIMVGDSKDEVSEKKEYIKPEEVDMDNLGGQIDNDLDEEVMFESGVTADKTGLNSKNITLPKPKINDEFIEKSQFTDNYNYNKLKKSNYLEKMRNERREYPSQSDYAKDLSISKYEEKYKYQTGKYSKNKFSRFRKQDHYDLKARKPELYLEVLHAADHCHISQTSLKPLISSVKSISSYLSPLLTNCKKRTPKKANYGPSDLEMLLYKLSKLPKDKIQFKAFVGRDASKLPILPNFDNKNPRPNKYGVVAQYKLKGVVQNAGPKYQRLKKSLLSNRNSPLSINYSKI